MRNRRRFSFRLLIGVKGVSIEVMYHCKKKKKQKKNLQFVLKELVSEFNGGRFSVNNELIAVPDQYAFLQMKIFKIMNLSESI